MWAMIAGVSLLPLSSSYLDNQADLEER